MTREKVRAKLGVYGEAALIARLAKVGAAPTPRPAAQVKDRELVRFTESFFPATRR